MTALLYLLAAIATAALATRAWLVDRDNPANIAFLGLGWSLAIAFLAFSASLLPGFGAVRLVYMAAMSTVPAFALYNVDHLFANRNQPTSRLVHRVFVLTAGVVPLAVGFQAWYGWDQPGPSVARVIAGLVSTVVLGLALRKLLAVHEQTTLKVDKLRLRYLIGVAAGAMVFTLAEQFARYLTTPEVLPGMSLSARGVELQGAIPPLGALLAVLAVYLMHHVLISSRLLDLYEVFSRFAALVATALVLVLVDGLTVLWADTFTTYPLHSTFQIFLASVLFLAAYDPIRDQIGWWFNRVLNQRGHQLAEALDGLRAVIPSTISKSTLVDTLLTRLHDSGRVPVCSIYLWNPVLDAYVLEDVRGNPGRELLAAVAALPFTTRFTEGKSRYIRDALVREGRVRPDALELVELMDAMGAQLTLPMRSGSLVLGWLHLADEDWSDGFSAEETEQLQYVTGMASVVLSNIQDFQAMEEKQRLEALGAMAAGLAHEIRNPLAGIKGAAQYLQSLGREADEADMLEVVVQETDRLNMVVTLFLEYARPYELRQDLDHVNAMIAHVLTLLRAQGIGDTLTITEALAGDLPPIPFDRVRLSQVVLNLCQNALQAMPEGGQLTLRTQHTVRRNGRAFVEIAVSDTGSGMTADVLENLFVPFYTTKTNGTGLGLAISQRIVLAHGGELDVQSTPGKGATFVVRLPMPLAQEELAPQTVLG